MKIKKTPEKLKKAVSGTLAVVLAATAMGPLFSVKSSARSFDYIEDLKRDLNRGGSFEVIEMVPDAEQTTMGFLSAGSEPLNIFADKASEKAGWTQSDRITYMTAVYNNLKGKGIIGDAGTTDYPLTMGEGYKEYFPWQVTKVDDRDYYRNEDLTNGVPKNGAKPLREVTLASSDSSIIHGTFTDAPKNDYGVPQGDYKLNASYSPSKKLFFYNEFNDKFGPSGTLWQVSNKLINYASGDNLNFNASDKSVSVSTGSIAHVLPVTTTYASSKGYFMEVERDTEYELSFHVNVNNNGKFYVAAYTTSAGELSSLIGATTLYPDKIYETSSDANVNESVGGTYKVTIKTPQMTDLTKKLYIQLCFGVDKTTNTTATFSDVYFGEPLGDVRGFVQDTDRFIYGSESYSDTDNDFWYNLIFTPISSADWETLDFNGIGIYEEIPGNPGNYRCVGVAGVDDAEALDLDYDKAMAGEYFTAAINEDVYDSSGKGLQTVTATRDEYHTYRATPVFEAGTSNLSFKKRNDSGFACGYFKALEKTYSYVGGNSDYVFEPDSSSPESITVYTKKAYYLNDFTNNDLFKKGALDYDVNTDNFPVTLSTVTPESLNVTESYLGRLKVTNMIVISAGTATSISTLPGKIKYTEDISEDVKNAILDAAGGTYKVPVAVDSRLIDPAYANVISSSELPNLYSLIYELIDRVTENGGVSIIGGGVSANIYAFNPSHIGGTAASIATKEIKRTISGANSNTSPYYDVKYQINYENNIKGTSNPLPNSEVNEASCFRCIINYRGRRIMSAIRNFRVLDIEPYTNDPQKQYYYPKSQYTAQNKSYIDEYIIGSQWLPDKYFENEQGEKVTITEDNAKDYITLTRMSTAELNGTGAKIVENYDLVYIGAAVGNLEKQATYKNGNTEIAYNDSRQEIKNKLYTSIGDAYTSGNIKYDGTNLKDMVKGTIEGETLAGLVDADYTSITGKQSRFSTYYIAPDHEFDLRTTGNDITRDVMDQLQDFADAGFPIVFANDLVESQTFSTQFTVKVTTKLVYRGTSGNDPWGEPTRVQDDNGNWASFKTNDAASGTDTVYFAFVKAELIGDVPKGIIPVFTWKWAKNGKEQGTKNVDYAEFYRSRTDAEKNGISSKESENWVEPIADESKLTTDQTARNWYSTIGDWNYQEHYKDQNGDKIISGISLNKKSDRDKLRYQKLNEDYRYYCDVTFRLPEQGETDYGVPVSDAYKQKFITNKLKLHSNEITFCNGNSDNSAYKKGFDYSRDPIDYNDNSLKKNCKQTFTLTGRRTGNDALAYVNISPNPRSCNVFVDYSELNWRHHARIGTYGDCGCNNGVHGTITNEDDGTMKITKTACDYAYLAIEGDINGEHSWDEVGAWGTGDRHGDYNCSWTSYITKYNVVPNSAWISGADDNSTGTITINMKGDTRVEERTVDNTTFLYQFMSKVYNKVDNTIDSSRSKVALPNIFAASDFNEEAGRDRLVTRIDSLQAPKLDVDPYTLVSYPDALPDRNLKIDFAVRNEKTAGAKAYEVHLYIDGNHDAVFSDYEETDPTLLKKKSSEAPEPQHVNNKLWTVTSSSSHGSDNQYTLEKTLPSSYVGIIPWKLVVMDPNETNAHGEKILHDSYIGYAYRKAGVGEGTVIKAVQVLPADQWSNSVAKRYNAVNNLISDYNSPSIRGIWRPNEKEDEDRPKEGGKYPKWYDVSKADVTKTPYDPETLRAAAKGNAYLGSLFLGTGAGRDGTIYKDDPNIAGDKVNEAWYLRENTTAKDITGRSNFIYEYTDVDFKNDAFYQLCIAEDSKLDRTVYYDPLQSEIDVDSGDQSDYQLDLKQKLKEQFALFSKDRIKYRTHVEFWVNPKGEKVPKTKADGSVMTDYFGNIIYTYEQFDFELDIALTDIYEMNFCWYQNMDAVEAKNDEGKPTDFLAQYDMLILGFGDSYGKYERQNRAGLNLAAATLGFNLYSALAIRNFIDSGRPVLFCHDTTNGNVNFVDYYALNVVSWFADVVDKVEEFWNTTVKETATRVWIWFRNVVRSFIGKEPIKIDEPRIDQEAELNNKIADNRTRDGYYNNLVLRYPLKLDRYGITYEISRSMNQKVNSSSSSTDTDTYYGTFWEDANFKHGHQFSYLLGTDIPAVDADGNVVNNKYVTTAETGNSETRGRVVSEVEMLAHGFTVAYEPSSAKRHTKAVDGDEEIVYTTYPDNTPGGTKMVDGVKVTATFGGEQVKADYIYESQGFTKWTIARYLTNRLYSDSSNADNYYMPITVPGKVDTPHRSPYITSAITQVGKGSITTYPYDVNTSKFNGLTGNQEDGKIRIMPTHDQYYQINLNDGDTTVWYCLADPSDSNKSTDPWEGTTCYDLLPNDCSNSYYIYTSGNVTYTGAGHANLFTIEEAELFINTLVGAYRAAQEKPEVYFRNEKDTLNIEYQMLTGDMDAQTEQVFVDKEITGVKIVDPNINIGVGGGLKVNFYKDSNLTQPITDIVLYEKDSNGKLKSTGIEHSAGGYPVTSDVTYYFYTPDAVLQAMNSGSESYTIYAQSSVENGEASNKASLEYRRLGLSPLA